MKRKAILTGAAVLLVLAALFWLLFGNPVILWHNKQLKESITGVTAETVTLNEVVPFRWDEVYTFSPYTSRERMEEVMGVRSSSIKETVNEGMTQLIFLEGDRVTASVCGYPSNLGYRVEFFDRIDWEDQTLFQVTDGGGLVSLTLKQE